MPVGLSGGVEPPSVAGPPPVGFGRADIDSGTRGRGQVNGLPPMERGQVNGIPSGAEGDVNGLPPKGRAKGPIPPEGSGAEEDRG